MDLVMLLRMENPPVPHSRNRIPSLDGLRAVSITMVVVSHSGIRRENRQWFAHPLVNQVFNGDLGVSVFFAISGYLITTLLVAEMGTTGRIDLRGFYVRRVRRIFPAFYAYLVLIRLADWAGWFAVPWKTWLTSAVFCRNYLTPLDRPPKDWYTSHIWSLSVEEQFYLFWPATLAMIGKRRAAWLAVGLIALSPFLRIATFYGWPYLRWATNNLLHTRLETLMTGCLAALLADSPRFRAMLRWAYSADLPAQSVIFLILVAPWLRITYLARYTMTVGYGIEAACIVLLILWAIDHADGVIGRVLNCRPVVRVGVLSYSIYLWQQPCTKLFNLPWAILAIWALAELSYRFVERPFLASRLARRDSPAAATPPSPCRRSWSRPTS
jgi:peptidoglycan/LPS O-acetylase OafA/YrhL